MQERLQFASHFPLDDVLFHFEDIRDQDVKLS